MKRAKFSSSGLARIRTYTYINTYLREYILMVLEICQVCKGMETQKKHNWLTRVGIELKAFWFWLHNNRQLVVNVLIPAGLTSTAKWAAANLD